LSATPTTENQTEVKKIQIEGVLFRPLRTISDERGFFREVMRRDDARTPASPTAAAHYTLAEGATFEADGAAYWYIPVGALQITLRDERPDAATFGAIAELGLESSEDSNLLILPSGVIATARALQPTQLVVFSL
jgi:dTDP-4-dehydrorhamnose 3,5-epimerase-like enzyme